MIKFKLQTPAGEVLVSVDPPQPGARASIVLEGPSNAVQLVGSWLPFESNAFGILLGEATRAEDLRYVLASDRAAHFHPLALVLR